MIISMTGYGGAATEDADLSIRIEVRAVNNRYLKVVVRAPEFLSRLEPEIERLVRKSVSRGVITATIYCRRLGTLAGPPINEQALHGYATELKRIADAMGIRGDLTIADLIGLPGVLGQEDETWDVDPIRDRVLATMQGALDDFQTMRRQEGKALETDLRHHTAVLRDELAEIAKLAPDVVEEYRDRLLERIAALLKESPMELAREALVTEVSIFAERSDISEEVSRLRSHLSQFEELLDGEQPTGRKLEFVAQEMLREANTAGSKSGHPEIGRRIIEMKSAIDRIKEQIQNAE